MQEGPSHRSTRLGVPVFYSNTVCQVNKLIGQRAHFLFLLNAAPQRLTNPRSKHRTYSITGLDGGCRTNAPIERFREKFRNIPGHFQGNIRHRGALGPPPRCAPREHRRPAGIVSAGVPPQNWTVRLGCTTPKMRCSAPRGPMRCASRGQLTSAGGSSRPSNPGWVMIKPRGSLHRPPSGNSVTPVRDSGIAGFLGMSAQTAEPRPPDPRIAGNPARDRRYSHSGATSNNMLGLAVNACDPPFTRQRRDQ